MNNKCTFFPSYDQQMTWMGKEAVFRKLQELGTIDQAAVSIGYNDPIHWLRR